MNSEQIEKLLTAAFSIMDLAQDSGLVWAEVRGVYEVARAEDREPTDEERSIISARAGRRLENFKAILDRDAEALR